MSAPSPVRASRTGWNPLIVPVNLVQVGTDADALLKTLWSLLRFSSPHLTRPA